MMTRDEFADHLGYLRLSLAEAAVLLGSSERSVRRWTEESVPGPVAAAVRAWRELEARRLPWKPDTISIMEGDQDQLDRIRAHDEVLAQVLKEVEARGGPAEPWAVDLERGRATFSHAEVGFHRLANGGFNVSTYRRFDRTPSDDDRLEIADAVYCIAQAFARAGASAEALRVIAAYTRAHSHLFVRQGPAMLAPADADQRRQAIIKQAEAIETLAGEVAVGRGSYAQFEEILRELHRLGFFPETALVSAVARNMLAATPLRSSAP